MQVQIPHRFSKAQAVARLKQGVAEAKLKGGDQVVIHEERWEGDTFHFDVTGQGQRISGTVGVTESHFDLYAKLPLMLRMFEGRIEAALKEQAAQLLK